MIGGNFSPHDKPYRPALPALFVGHDAGVALRDAANAGKTARLTMHAQWVDCKVPSVTAVLPGESDEAMILDTHTDGQNFIEEIRQNHVLRDENAELRSQRDRVRSIVT